MFCCISMQLSITSVAPLPKRKAERNGKEDKVKVKDKTKRRSTGFPLKLLLKSQSPTLKWPLWEKVKRANNIGENGQNRLGTES